MAAQIENQVREAKGLLPLEVTSEKEQASKPADK
jgi:hypothetical protein